MTSEYIMVFILCGLCALLGWCSRILREKIVGDDEEADDDLLTTEKGIIQAISCCAASDCTKCPLRKAGPIWKCTKTLINAGLHLICQQRRIIEDVEEKVSDLIDYARMETNKTKQED